MCLRRFGARGSFTMRSSRLCSTQPCFATACRAGCDTDAGALSLVPFQTGPARARFPSATDALRTSRGGGSSHEQPTDRRGNCSTDAVRIGAASDADSDPDRLQRRVLSRSAERTAARGRSAPAGDGRRSRRQAGPGSPPLLPDRGRHGGVVRGDERGLRPAVRGEQGGSRDARHGPGARRPRSRTSSSWTCTRTSCATTRAS